MGISATVGPRRRRAILLSSFNVAEETENRVELHTKRITAFFAAAFLAVFGGVFTGAAWHFYSPYRTAPQVLMVGGLGIVLLALALLMLYFGLRRPDRIVIDRTAGEVVFDRRRDPLRFALDRIVEVNVETENRSRGRERCIVHPVVLVTDDGNKVEIDAGSNIEEMIRLAAKLRRVLGKMRSALICAIVILMATAARADGTLDVVFARGADLPDELCRGDGAGGFSCSSLAQPGSTDVAIAEVNGDDHPDLILATDLGDNIVCLGEGTGAFDTCAPISGSGSDSVGVAVASLNSGDPHLDLVFANAGEQNTVCTGNGMGGFSCTGVSADTNDSRDAATGHLGGSNWLDAVFANANERNSVCFGDGTGGFVSCGAISSNTDLSSAVAVGDVEGDGDEDVVFANIGQRERICYRSGNTFSCQDLLQAPALFTWGVALGQLNGSGRLDAVFADIGGPSRVCLELGTNNPCTDVFPTDRSAVDVALGLVNDDLRLDAVFVMADGAPEVCYGDGSGQFGSCVVLDSPFDFGLGVDLGEVESLIFADGFESGDTSAWSVTVE